MNSMKRLDQQGKLIDGQARLPDYRAQRPFRNFIVIRDYQAPIGWNCLAEDQVATVLPIEFVSNLS